ncbi:hypothetical protein BDC45DRAFT_542418 [Circinella umbellata]|nr:hypothetical protein BDC45DRAFT_542418 [Circinella umbellata]
MNRRFSMTNAMKKRMTIATNLHAEKIKSTTSVEKSRSYWHIANSEFNILLRSTIMPKNFGSVSPQCELWHSDTALIVEDLFTFFAPPSVINIPHVERVQTLQDKMSIEFYKLAKDHNLSNEAYDKFIKLFNTYIKDDQFAKSLKIK